MDGFPMVVAFMAEVYANGRNIGGEAMAGMGVAMAGMRAMVCG